MLHEVVCGHLAALNDPDTFSFTHLGLIKPRKAPQRVVEFVRHAFDLPDEIDIDCQHAITSHPSESVYCSVDDAILLQE